MRIINDMSIMLLIQTHQHAIIVLIILDVGMSLIKVSSMTSTHEVTICNKKLSIIFGTLFSDQIECNDHNIALTLDCVDTVMMLILRLCQFETGTLYCKCWPYNINND